MTEAPAPADLWFHRKVRQLGEALKRVSPDRLREIEPQLVALLDGEQLPLFLDPMEPPKARDPHEQ